MTDCTQLQSFLAYVSKKRGVKFKTMPPMGTNIQLKKHCVLNYCPFVNLHHM